MNDFTKEELFILLEETDPGIYDDLRIKIQSMIEGYCEHELEDWSLMDNNQKICIKCERIMHE